MKKRLKKKKKIKTQISIHNEKCVLNFFLHIVFNNLYSHILCILKLIGKI